MGGSSQTIGWNYRLAWHDCLCLGPLDAFLEFRGADKQAWKGRMTSSGLASVNQPRLWGGDKDQGGAVGNLRVLFGEAGQMPPAYLTSVLSARTGAWRGIATVVWEGGLWGANNPYQQKRSYRVERLVKGWDNDDCWYPAKAPVLLEGDFTSGGGSPGGPGVPSEFIYNVGQRAVFGGDATKWAGDSRATVALIESCGFTYTTVDQAYWSWRPNESGLHYVKLTGESDETMALSLLAQGWGPNQSAIAKFNNGRLRMVVLTTVNEPPYAPDLFGYAWSLTAVAGMASDFGPVWMWSVALGPAGLNVPSAPEPPEFPRYGKNPAHMILFAHTQKWAGRQPRDSVDLVQLQAAADWYYARGFGLCTIRKRMEESPREFIRRIEKVAGCSFSQSFDDGLWHLDIANGEYVLDDLPVITDADVLSFKFTPTTQDDAVNSVSVQYFDPERKEKIITTPTRAMGLIARFGEIHQTFEYPEIPIGRIALMVALRELLASITPGGLFELDVMPWLAKLRKNQYVRLQLPKRGIADMVCLVGEVKNGKLKSGAVKLSLGVDIYSLPQTVYGGIELGEDPRPPTTPADLVDQVAFEAPYIDVVARMPAPDFAALPEDAGYVVAAASNPGRMRNFTMLVAPDGGAYDEVDEGEFCPSCTLTGTIEPGLQVGIGYTNAKNMAAVQVGDMALVNGELVRVDAVDLDANTIDLGRGCGDSLPDKHEAGSVILFYQVANGYDRTQHIAGETVQVKLLTNSVSEQMDQAAAPAIDVTFDYRLDRPYPAGDYRLDGASVYEIGTATPGSGGGGGGGGTTPPPSPPAQAPGGGPASPVPGPNGGYADDAPYPIPLPPSGGGEVIDDGGFDTPGYPTGWANKDGTPLDSRWFVDVDGKLHYQGVGSSAAYYFPARFSIPWQPVPRYEIPVSADVRTDIGVTAAVGCTWGVGTYGPALTYEDVSAYAEYVVETTVPHSFIYVPPGLVSGLGYVDQIPIVNFVPVLSVHSDSALVVNATFDNVTVTPDVIPMPTTPEALTNLDFSSGLTGWTKYPDLTGNPYEATISVSGGELSMTGNSLYHTTQHFINDTPIALNDIGRYTLTELEAWCNDTTTLRGFTQNGVLIGIATKYGGAYTGVAVSGAYRRGDWTPIQAALRHAADGTVTPGITLHEVISMRVNPGFTAKVRNINVATTDDIIDPVVL